MTVVGAPTVRFCGRCGGALEPGARFCGNCGTLVETPLVSASDTRGRGALSRPGSLYAREHDRLEHLMVGNQLTRTVGRGTVILDHVDVAVRRGQFVVIAGGSGTGKSTLMKVLNGYHRPDAGERRMAGGTTHLSLGYVPQDDIIHRELELRQGLILSALLRFPPGTRRTLVEARADEVLAELGLQEHVRTRVSRLSGGQRKRASVALELMTRPSLLLLDEPTSGLDPASDHHLITLLRSLADSGYGVVLITHTAADLPACDTVAFLGHGGRLVFWGTPEDAKGFFGVQSLEDVYELIDDGEPAEWWRRRFHETSAYAALRRDVGEGMQALPPAPARPEPTQSSVDLRWQLRGLARRYAATLLGDRRNLLFLLGQVPIIVGLARILFPGDTLTSPGDGSPAALAGAAPSGNGFHGIQLLFVIGATVVWLGTINSAREICKELPIWERESHIGVGPIPYVLSKILVLGFLTMVQALLVVVLLLWLWTVPDAGGTWLQLTLVIAAGGWVGMGMGLVISALVSSSDRAVTLIPIVMIPQLLFGGVIVSLSDMGPVGRGLSAAFASRWTFSALARSTGRQQYVAAPLSDTYELDGTWLVPAFELFVLCLAFLAIAGAVVRARSRRTGRG